MPPSILFLDDDPVIRVVRLALSDAAEDPWLRDYFLPEAVDLGALVQAARGLRRSDGVEIACAALGERIASSGGARIIVFRRGAVTAELIDAHPGLRLVQRLGARADDIDLAAAAARGIQVSCLPRRSLAYTAEHTLMLMLALAKRLLPADRTVREGGRDDASVRPSGSVAYNWAAISDAGGLSGKTLGVVGLGEVGTLVARLAGAFGMQVRYHSRRRAPPEREQALGARYATLAELLAQADFVALLASDTPENEGLAGRDFFAAMRPGAFFVNVSRGRLVDEDALYDALARGAIAGAGLDVHRVEPRPAGDRFARLPNVVLTPHVAGGSRSALLDELAELLDNCRAALAGRPPRHLVGAAT